MAEFFSMGGYAAYVWSAYGLSALVLIVNALLPSRHEHHLLKRISREHGGSST